MRSHCNSRATIAENSAGETGEHLLQLPEAVGWRSRRQTSSPDALADTGQARLDDSGWRQYFGGRQIGGRKYNGGDGAWRVHRWRSTGKWQGGHDLLEERGDEMADELSVRSRVRGRAPSANLAKQAQARGHRGPGAAAAKSICTCAPTANAVSGAGRPLAWSEENYVGHTMSVRTHFLERTLKAG